MTAATIDLPVLADGQLDSDQAPLQQLADAVGGLCSAGAGLALQRAAVRWRTPTPGSSWRSRGRVLRRRRNRPYSAAWTGHLAGVPATLSPYWRCRPASCSAAPLPECVPTTSTIRGGLSSSCRWHQP